MSNLFELLVVSSRDKRFTEWIKCFEVLFNVTADQIMTDYNELIPLVNVTTNTYQYNNKLDDRYDDESRNTDNHYNWITLLPNRYRF